MESTNFKQCRADPCILGQAEGTNLTLISVYVDDLIIITKTPETMRRIKDSLETCFKMMDLGKLHYIAWGLLLNMMKRRNVYGCTRGSIFSHYWKDTDYLKQKHIQPQQPVKDEGMSKPVDPVFYQSMVGSLLYAAIATRTDISQAVGAVSKFNSCPTEAHLTAVKRVFRYLEGTINLGLKYERSDADWARDMDN